MASLQSIARALGQAGKNIGQTLASPFVETGQNLFTLAALADPRTREKLAFEGREGFGALSGLIKPEEDLAAMDRARKQGLGAMAGEVYEQGVKPSAGVAAFGVPMGKGASILSRATLPAATSGGLFSLSQTPRGTGLGQTLTNVGKGAALAGALGTGIEALRNPQLVRQELQQAFQTAPTPQPAYAQAGQPAIMRFEGQPSPVTERMATEMAGRPVQEVTSPENISKVAEKAARELKKSGGYSFDLKGQTPKTGYQLSLQPEKELVVLKADDAGREAIRNYAQANYELLKQKGNYLGGWIDEATGRVHFDVSTKVDDLADAIRRGAEANQLAIWDNALGKEIRLTPQLLKDYGIKSAAEAVGAIIGMMPMLQQGKGLFAQQANP
jgi:hypothetical protein